MLKKEEKPIIKKKKSLPETCSCGFVHSPKRHRKAAIKIPLLKTNKAGVKMPVYKIEKSIDDKGKTRNKRIQQFIDKPAESIPYSRAELICHCDSCGRKWGEHNYPDISEMKPYCAGCGEIIHGQNQKLYEDRGNFCDSCLRVVSANANFHQKEKALSKEESKAAFAALFKQKEEAKIDAASSEEEETIEIPEDLEEPLIEI